MLAGQKGLARTSSDPGRTRLVNYFDFGTFILADLPGYGYARVSQGEKEKWARLLDDFFGTGEVAHVFALVDIRHAPSADDALMVDYLYKTRTPFTLIATKADQARQNAARSRRARARRGAENGGGEHRRHLRGGEPRQGTGACARRRDLRPRRRRGGRRGGRRVSFAPPLFRGGVFTSFARGVLRVRGVVAMPVRGFRFFAAAARFFL